MHITTKRLEKILNNSKEVKISNQSRILMIAVDEQEYRVQANNPEQHVEGIAANVLGATPTLIEDFEFLVIWLLRNCWYQRSKGINVNVAEVVIEAVELPSNLQVYDEDGRLISMGDLEAFVKPYFVNNYQQWKMEAMLLPINAQPSHFSRKTSWGVNDIVPVQDIRTRDLASLVKDEGMHHQGCYVLSEKISKDTAVIHGYASYRIGSELSAGHLMLNWLIRIVAGEGKLMRPEIAIIESDKVPGLVLSGMNLCDKNGNPLSPNQETVHLMRLLQDYREWTDGCVNIFTDFVRMHFSENDQAQEWLTAVDAQKNLDNVESIQLELFSTLEPQTKTFIVETNNEPDLSFKGVRLGRVIDSSKQGLSRILDLYQTQEGSWVCVKKSMFEGQEAREELVVKVLSSKQEVINFFGSDQFAKTLYKQANIDYFRRID